MHKKVSLLKNNTSNIIDSLFDISNYGTNNKTTLYKNNQNLLKESFNSSLNKKSYNNNNENKNFDSQSISTNSNSVKNISNDVDKNLEAWYNHQKSNYNITRLKLNDETKFAEAEATNLLDKLNRLKINQLKVWQKLDKQSESIRSETRVATQLPNIRKDLSRGLFGKLSSKYLSDQQIDTIDDALKIIQKRKILDNNPRLHEDDKIPIMDFVSAKKEVWLRNMLLSILSEESRELKNKDVKIKSALELGEDKLNKDIKRFNEFCEKENRKRLKEEADLSEITNSNKALSDYHKKLVHDKKSLIDEIDKLNRQIILSKSHAVFICYSLGDRDNISNYFNLNGFDFNLFEFANIIPKDKDVYKVAVSLM
jgi:hypothetical protein